MELKVNYQYTYFIKPFLIKENNYEKYLLTLLKNQNCKLKIFEKEKDYNLYNFFLQNVREYFFPSFSFDRDIINEFNEMSNPLKVSILSKLHCNTFEYILDKKIQGKVDETDGIFFNIDKIEIICLDTGICFLVMKTNLDSSDKFSELLDFNYKFKDINSELSKLKDYNNIKIQTDAFGNMTELSDFVNYITGINDNLNELEGIDLYNKRFFVYTYCCINQENWNSEEDFKNIENDFFKYCNVLSNNTSLDFNGEELKQTTITDEQFKHSKFGFTKQSSCLMTSNIEIANYTKLLFDYENEYLYTTLIRLYQRIYLKKLENEFKDNKNMSDVRLKFSKFTKEIWFGEISNSLSGTLFYNKWKEVFELQNIYDQIKNKYDIVYKEAKIEKNNKVNKMILIALIVSLSLNVLNLIALIKLS